jgi:signal transduction histidine kinase
MRTHARPFAVRRSSLRSNAALIDCLVAALLFAVGLGVVAGVSQDDSPVVAACCCVVMAGAVALRRPMPTLAAVAALLGLVGYELVTHDPTLASPSVPVLLTLYTVGRWAAPRGRNVRLVLVAALGLAAMWAVSLQLKDPPGEAASSWLVSVLAPLAVGVLLARRNRLSRRLADAAGQLRAEQDHNAAQATAEERNRVARELHDVVAHCVSVMVVQAGAARLVAAHNSADADRALAVIGGCGRVAMADLRRIVGVLRRSADPDFGRGAGLAGLGLLVGRIRSAGVPTGLHIGGSANPPPSVDVVAYRVVQEALTNVVKHAGDGATANVDVFVGPQAVTVEVTNTQVAAPPRFTPSGHGLVGMSERITAYGGELRVGPLADGGYGVRAQIPFYPVGRSDLTASGTLRRRVMRPSQWMSTRIANAMVVACWLVVMEIEVATSSAPRGPLLLNGAAVAVMAVAAGWRRRYPLMFLAIVGTLAVVLSGGLTSLDRSTITGFYSLAVPLFTVAAWEPRGRAAAGLALWAIGASSVVAVHKDPVAGLAGALVMSIVVWAAGRVWRAQLLLTVDLTETTTRLAAERDQRAQLAVATERTRIARDLHGAVANGVITMVVQAEAARKLLTHRPGEVEAAIREIEQTGRDALSQLRRILGVLRSPTGPPVATAFGEAAGPPAPRLGEHTTWAAAEQVLT